jgi:RHS repeat-associated protein
LGAHPFGENVDLYTGALSFEVTDISIPGNGPTLTLGRSLKTAEDSLDAEDAITGKGGFFRPFGEWDLDIPRIETNAAWQMGVGGWVVGSGSKNRCMGFSVPPPVPSTSPPDLDWQPDRWWYGYHLVIPGQGSQDLLDGGNPPAHQPAGGGYPIVTKKDWMIGCGVTANDGGEGFVALAPDGTRYTFAHLVYRTMPWTERPTGSTGDVMKNDADYLARYDAAMFVTQIKDRFGNTLTYNWTNADPTDAVNNRLTSIMASDGRQLSLTYVPGTGRIQTATLSASDAPARTWTYFYGGNADFPSLTQVKLPDGSAWSYQIGSLESTTLNTQGGSCVDDKLPLLSSGPASGSMTHPSGLMATFTIAPILHGRSYVNKQCWYPYSGSTTTYATIPNEYYQYSLTEEDISGPGIPAGSNTCKSGVLCWKYSYSPANQSWTSDPCAQTSSCPTTVYTDVLDPLGHDVRHTFSNRFDASESLLQRTDDYSGAVGSTTLRSEADSYASPTGGPWPSDYGRDLQTRENHAEVEELSPLQKRVITQDGATFTSTVNTFDSYARSTEETDSSSLGFSKTVSNAYYDDLTHWVLGQISSNAVNATASACTSNNAGTTSFATCTLYDSASALPLKEYAFGKLQSAKTWNSDGTLHTIADGATNTTTFSNWKRGIPQSIKFADGYTKSATVNDNGWITAITDENTYTTKYGYDSMGRLASITYPTGDDVTWNTTTLAFQQINASEWGIPAGHWRQMVQTGNGLTYTFYDALWRPLVAEHFDSANVAGTISQTVTRYDADGRTAFASYPLSNMGLNYATANTGTHTYYDALARVTEVDQDSELGLLKTKTQYATGFEATVTNPRGYVTTTDYMAFDTPTTQWPTKINAPERELTQISRDAFGKPLSINRSVGPPPRAPGPNGLMASPTSIASYYVYDAHQQLCKRIDNGHVDFYTYDPAGNVDWTAQGVNAFTSQSCSDVTTANAGTHLVTRTYDARNRLKTLHFTDSDGDQGWTYTPDGLPLQITSNNQGNSVINAYTYDKRRLLIGESLSQPGWYTWGIGYGYDVNGHLSTRYTPSHQNYFYSPNALGQPTALGIQNVATYISGVSYWPDGNIKQYTYANGIVHTLQENTRLLPSRITDKSRTTTAVDIVYSYDNDSDRTLVNDVGGNGVHSASLTYDGLDRLYTANLVAGGSVPTTYYYNVFDQITQVLIGTQTRTFSYDPQYTDQLTSVTDSVSGTTTYGYDAQGNLATRNGVQYEFDYGNRLRDVVGQEYYRYDGYGRRVLQYSPTLGNILPQYDNSGHLVYVSDQRTGLNHDYLYLGGTLVAIRDYQNGVATAMRYQHTDALGSIISQTNSSGSVLQSAAYGAYGKLLSRSNDDAPGYTGHVMDAATGLTYMQQRYYDPDTDRFLSMDPVDVDTTNGANFDRYWYANDNPYRFTDPDGRDALWIANSDGTATLVIPVNFTGSGATHETVMNVITKDDTLNVGGAKVQVDVVATDKPMGGVLNKMDLSPGLDTKHYGDAGEGVNKLGGDTAHINSDSKSVVGAAAHDVLHFAGINDQYKEGPRDSQGNRTSTPKPGYDNSNIMTSRNGTNLKPEQLQEAEQNQSTKHCTRTTNAGGVSC